MNRVLKCGMLTLLAATLVGVSSTEARMGYPTCGYSPVYYTTYCTPICYPVCYPPVVIPTGVDCVCNHTKETLRIHISSGFGHVDAVVPPKYCFYFLWRKDNTKNRVCTAFTLNNDLVANFPFTPIDQCTLKKHICLNISGTTAAPTMKPERQAMDGDGATPQPTNGAL
jgi:hypothetical protein